jgi:ABC-type phosphate transport system substrate-binding protein
VRISPLVILALNFSLEIATARADIVVVVSRASAVTTLDKNEVVDIFLGNSARFSNGERAVPIDQREGTAERNKFYASFADWSAAQLKAHWSKIIFTGRGRPPRVISNSSELKNLLLENPNSIGYMEQSAVDDSVRVVLIQ